MGMDYPITITNGDYLRAGCQNHTIEDWRKFTKKEIAEMDGRKALKFYPRLLDVIDFHLGKGERPEWLGEKDEEQHPGHDAGWIGETAFPSRTFGNPDYFYPAVCQPTHWMPLPEIPKFEDE
ncbi:DUF551 domain-containing protein [Mixta mediterraneensis]|uniref:DUF551 domain-containing protein n=1 Tax=Mixta mediterraneensis TaxID=2758443 RepID=UPI001EEDD444|nr:DUF551 domain-containing protein [Mixta mediterraneensis]